MAQRAVNGVLQPLNQNNMNNRMSMGRAARKSTGPKLSLSTTGRQSLIPQTSRNSSIGGRTSIAPRQSGIGVVPVPKRASVAHGKGDPRPISDKVFMSQSIRNIIQYLTSTGYEHEISQKILSSPTGRDFQNIVAFLGRQLDPQFVITKAEDDIPTIFKNFRYPFSLSKKGMSSVGAPHTWPTMLAAIAWIVELLTYWRNSDDALTWENIDFEADNIASEKLFFEFNIKAYAEFLDGQDDFEELENELASVFESKNEIVKRDIEGLENMKQQMLREIEELTTGPDRVEPLREVKATFESDISKFKTLVNNLINMKADMEKKTIILQTEIDNKQEEILSVQKEKAELTETVERQEISPADVERMNNEKAQLEELLTNVANQKDTIEKVIFDKEIQISKKAEDVEREISQFNSLGRKLRIIPSNAKYANNINYQLTFLSHAPDHVVDTIKSTIKPSLDTLRVNLSRNILQCREELLTTKDKTDRCEEFISDKKDEIAVVESKTKKVENTYKKEKERMKDQLKQRQMEIENIQQEINRLKDTSAQTLSQSNKSLETLRQEYQELNNKFSIEKEEMNNCIIQTLENLATHKAYLQDNLTALMKYYNQVKSTVMIQK